LKTIKINATKSTNDYLKALSRENELEDGLIVVAFNQTKGRGQRENKWVSRAGESLTFSIFKRGTGVSASQKSALTFAVSVGLKMALDALQIPSVEIKWPNDIMSDSKKIAGILIENSLLGGVITSSVIGIGLNVNEERFEGLPKATSMYLSSGHKYDLEQVLKTVSEAVLFQLNLLKNGGISEVKKKYENNLFRRDTISVFESETGVKFNGIIRAVTDEGELLIETEQASVEKYSLKEIKLVY
jgi:BirA family biotin operon repressor/biotin-[acetyl-CoA-carboxylase] ligase